MQHVTVQQAQTLLGKPIFAKRRDGSVVTGILIRVEHDRLILAQLKEEHGKYVQSRALLPLILFDLLVIGTLPLWGGGFGGKGNCCNTNNYYNSCCPPAPTPYGYGNKGYPQQDFNQGYNYGNYNGNNGNYNGNNNFYNGY